MRRQTNNNQSSLFSSSPSLSSASVWDDRPKPTFRKKTQRHQQQHDSSWGSFLPSSSPTGQPFEETLDTKQELEQRRIAKQDACLASSKRSLRMLEESLAVGAETLVELDRQGEQIRRCNDRMEEIHDNLNTSDRLIRGIGSWFGAFVNSVTSPPAKSSSGARSSQKSRHPSTTPSSSKQQKQQQQLKEPTTTKQSGRRRSTTRGGREEVHEDSDQHSFDRFMEETDRDLDEMEEKLQGLQRLAMTMSDELQDQDGELDKLSGNAERANERIRKNTLKVWKLT